MKNKKNKCIRVRAGFSLVEVLLALMILSVGISTVAILMTANTNSSINTKNQVISSELAQEGIELVRNLKDNNALDSLTAVGSPYNKIIDKSGTFADVSANNKKLYLNGGFYTHNAAGTPTKFYRAISLSVTGDKAALPLSTRVITATAFVSWNPTGSIAPCNIANQCVSVVSVLPDLK